MRARKILMTVFIIFSLIILSEGAFILFYSNYSNKSFTNKTRSPSPSSPSPSPPLTLEPNEGPTTIIENILRDSIFHSMVKNGIVESSIIINKIKTKLISVEKKDNPELLFITIKNGDEKVTYVYNKIYFDRISVFSNNKKINIEDLKTGDDIEMVFEFDGLAPPDSDIRSLKIRKL